MELLEREEQRGARSVPVSVDQPETVAGLIEALVRALGGEVRLHAGRVQVRGALPVSVRQALRRHQPTLARLLHPAAAPHPLPEKPEKPEKSPGCSPPHPLPEKPEKPEKSVSGAVDACPRCARLDAEAAKVLEELADRLPPSLRALSSEKLGVLLRWTFIALTNPRSAWPPPPPPPRGRRARPSLAAAIDALGGEPVPGGADSDSDAGEEEDGANG